MTGGSMEFGLSLSAMIQQPRGGDMRARLEEIVDWTEEARDLGFGYVLTGQHYLSYPYEALQALPLLARLAAVSGDMRLVTTLLLPLHHPVDLAERLATLDVICGGRLTVVAARGYREEEFRAFGFEARDATGRLVECLECLRRLWSGEAVRFAGRHFALDGATIGILPLQRPHPPVWLAAHADAAVARAARLGMPWSISGHVDLGTVERQVAMYREEARLAGHDGDVALPLGRELYCAPTRERAWEEAGKYLAGKYETYAGWGQDRALPGDASFRLPFEELARDRFIIGDPDDCERELRRYQALGIGRCHLRMIWAEMPAELARSSLRLFAREVAPRFAATAGTA